MYMYFVRFFESVNNDHMLRNWHNVFNIMFLAPLRSLSTATSHLLHSNALDMLFGFRNPQQLHVRLVYASFIIMSEHPSDQIRNKHSKKIIFIFVSTKWADKEVKLVINRIAWNIVSTTNRHAVSTVAAHHPYLTHPHLTHPHLTIHPHLTQDHA